MEEKKSIGMVFGRVHVCRVEYFNQRRMEVTSDP